jgi:choline dehydrogenase-like flavoprotein
LLEAGGANNSSSMRVLADRFVMAFTHVDSNWSYVTEPQENFDGRLIPYARGKGLGGSSGINFACWTIGPKDDYDEWARIVDDEAFSWQNTQRRYKELESFDLEVSAPYAKYARPLAKNHGTSGPVRIEFAKSWEKHITNAVDACDHYGLGQCEDINSGNPIGMGVCPSTAYNSVKWTAASAYLEPAPSNLTVKTGIIISKILFDGTRAVGVQTLDGEQCKMPKSSCS